MPTLNWIGKEAVVNHHQQVPFRLLKDVPDLACGDPGSGNLIVQGDNLEALKALLPYAGCLLSRDRLRPPASPSAKRRMRSRCRERVSRRGRGATQRGRRT